MSGLPIGDYALLSDCRSAALVSRRGSVDWLCCPRFDSPAFFARILDERAGHFAIHPAGGFETSRGYVPQTMVLETTFRSGSGTAALSTRPRPSPRPWMAPRCRDGHECPRDCGGLAAGEATSCSLAAAAFFS